MPELPANIEPVAVNLTVICQSHNMLTAISRKHLYDILSSEFFDDLQVARPEVLCLRATRIRIGVLLIV